EQQTMDTPIPAKRGIIYDRNMKEMAISAVTNTIWARPADVKSARTEEEGQKKRENTATVLSEILEMDQDEVLKIISAKKSLVKVAKYVNKEKADLIREAQLSGISIAEDVKRYYPLGAFASHVLGSTTDDNRGLSGIELKYDKYLSGTPGRWIKNTDVAGDSLSYGIEKYYQAEDGLSVVLTIDEVIQHYVEKTIKQVQANTQAKRVFCVIMDPRTGDILAMAMTPDFDPNDPRKPLDNKEEEYVKGLSNEDKLIYWNDMWRNPMVSDTYEPGSTFKLITTSIALEEGVTNPNENFTCTGSYMVAGTKLSCWRSYRPHGAQTLTKAVQNSCNPVFVQLALRLGIETYYEYLDKFGLIEKTGIDFPGEGGNILQNKETAGPVGLATMSYGQGIAVTPISLISAVSALGNKGMLMQPRLVKALLDQEGNIIESFEPQIIRRVVSQQTAEEMSLIMETVVSEGGGGTAKVPGYRIGGKTGTANKVVNGVYVDDTYSSFIGMAPMDDPQLTILLVVDSPQGVKFGSQTAAPGVKAILEETLRYLSIQPSYSDEEQIKIEGQMVMVPSLINENFSEAIGILGGAELSYIVSPTTESNEDFTIVDQYPKAGEKVKKGTNVYLYWK
ncbi:MAG: penicillin-binding transpeptidase domain-containing protein, partial [Eubacteriales bacterium]|nr:penicillin-binding transpeptidase domain-containing protein [Eubacteriales bacterium]